MANAKFKVGDKVKVIGANGFNSTSPVIYGYIGKTGEITEVRKFPDGDIGYCFLFENNGMEDYCFDERSLEKVDETKNWFNIDIRSEGDKTVAYYIDRNGEQKVSVLRYKDDEYDPKVAIDYLMQKVDFSGAKAKVETKDDNWQCGDLVTYNGEKAEIVATNQGSVMLDFKFELEFTFRADRTAFIYYDKDGNVWRANNKKKTYIVVAKDDKDLELIKAVRKVEKKIPEAPKKKSDPKIPEIEFPFEIGDRIYIKNRFSDRINNKTATVVAHDVTDGACLVKVDVPDDCFNKGGSNGNSYKNIVDENGVPYKFSGKPEYWWITEKRFGELIKDEKPVSAKFNIGDRVMCTYDYGYGATQTGYGTVVGYTNDYCLEIGYLVKVDSEYRHDIPCHNGLEDFYEPYIAVGKNWTNESEEKSFRYFGIDDLKKVK